MIKKQWLKIIYILLKKKKKSAIRFQIRLEQKVGLLYLLDLYCFSCKAKNYFGNQLGTMHKHLFFNSLTVVIFYLLDRNENKVKSLLRYVSYLKILHKHRHYSFVASHYRYKHKKQEEGCGGVVHHSVKPRNPIRFRRSKGEDEEKPHN